MLTKVESFFRKNFPYEPTPGQEELISLLSNFVVNRSDDGVFIIKGYAGTGKTSIVTALIKVIKRLGKEVVLLAPTGRAAKVLSNYSNFEASTIHRKIYQPVIGPNGSPGFKLKPKYPENTFFIVDEASMISSGAPQNDNELFGARDILNDLIDFVYKGVDCNLILIGDTAQLPPVKMSQSPALSAKYLSENFGLTVKVHELTDVVRQELTSGILANATDLREILSDPKITQPNFNVNGKDVKRMNMMDLEEQLQTCFSGSTMNDSVIICRSNKSANKYNQYVRSKILFREEEISGGDHLMVLKNNYFWLEDGSEAGFIANGDCLRISRIIKHKTIEEFRFIFAEVEMLDYQSQNPFECWLMLNTLASETPALAYKDLQRLLEVIIKDSGGVKSKKDIVALIGSNPYYNALQIKFSYAVTCHKAQGGQWKNVVVDPGYFVPDMLNEDYVRWLYTAITRASSQLYLVNFVPSFFGEVNPTYH